MEPVIDHIQITVKDMAIAVPFYEKFLPLLGFDPAKKGSAVIDAHEFHVVEWSHPRLCFAITSPRNAFSSESINRRKPGALHHLAFRASSREEVDKLHTELLLIGATIVAAPRCIRSTRHQVITLCTLRILRALNTKLSVIHKAKRDFLSGLILSW